MNPQVDAETIAEAYADDPMAAAAEYGGQFRSDLESFISREALEAVVSRNVYERGQITGVRYVGFCDPSGGSRDSFTAAVAHIDGDKTILDAVREKKAPFSPDAVVEEYADFFKSYRVTSIRGDRYSGEFVRELFRKRGIEYQLKHSKQERYLFGSAARDQFRPGRAARQQANAHPALHA